MVLNTELKVSGDEIFDHDFVHSFAASQYIMSLAYVPFAGKRRLGLTKLSLFLLFSPTASPLDKCSLSF